MVGALSAGRVSDWIGRRLTVLIWLLGKAGRRPLLLSGTVGMAAGMTIAAPQLPWRRAPDRRARDRRGGRPAHLHRVVRDRPWTGVLAADRRNLPAEDPRRGDERGVHANWAANFVVTISFLTLLSAVGGVGAFFLFGFLTLAYFWRKVPETKGRSLQEIERELVPVRA